LENRFVDADTNRAGKKKKKKRLPLWKNLINYAQRENYTAQARK
jgi:ribosomal protein S30